MTGAPLLAAQSVRKRYARDLRRSRSYAVRDIIRDVLPRSATEVQLREGEFWALDGVNLAVDRGEALGVIGDNGAGKTTLLRLLHGLVRPDGGSIELRGTSMALIDIGSSFAGAISGRENILAEAVLLGFDGRAKDKLVREVAEFAELGPALDAPVNTYSSGMRLRLAFAIAAQSEPDVLLVDETIAVGDVNFQRKCVRHIRNYLERGGALVLVSHDLWMINALCGRCLVLDHGRVVEDSITSEALVNYLRSAKVAPEDRMSGLGPLDGSQVVPSPPAGEGAAQGVVVRAVAVHAVGGGPPSHGSPTLIDLDIETVAPVPDLEIAVSLRLAGQRVGLLSVTGPTLTSLALGGGVSRVRARIDSFPLFGGEFAVDVVLSAREGDVLATYTESVPSVEVSARPDQFETLGHLAGSLGSLPGGFSVHASGR